MRSFDEIHAIATERHGSDGLAARLSTPLTPEALAAIPEDRWLAQLTRCVFQAGFNWKVIEAKWDGFEAAFHGFDVGRCAMMDDDWLDDLLVDTRIVRNGPKIQTVRDNAVFLQSLRDQGGAGVVLGAWRSTDYIDLLDLMKSGGSRLGAMTGQYAMRFLGRDGFILSRDVTARLIAEGVIDKPAGSKSSMRAVQGAFNVWMEQSGRGLTRISQILAMSV
ncbi:DNA-3-methyladenine glycosylase I [Nioella nitratireducens]|uniref:DNA-3-methyladenine glycosylase I n=1 Tax=Nioella nitratireducens TaxID=1287720 RepID=UPI0008FD9449|nr:DNA-3-methyladenine glycosylase I [Nioella nitratireducens]